MNHQEIVKRLRADFSDPERAAKRVYRLSAGKGIYYRRLEVLHMLGVAKSPRGMFGLDAEETQATAAWLRQELDSIEAQLAPARKEIRELASTGITHGEICAQAGHLGQGGAFERYVLDVV